MRPFVFERADSSSAAVLAAAGRAPSPMSGAAPAQFLAGGTTLIDLVKLDVMRPDLVIDINALERTELGRIETTGNGLRLGALVRMADAMEHPEVRRDYPVIAQSLMLAASAQIRNMASLGGNVLQRTRCTYFRDTSYPNCNKRNPGSGCAAMDGFNRVHAVLGVSDQCIATYPGDFAQALIALDAVVSIVGSETTRTLPFAALHRMPGDAPDIETTLRSGEVIASFLVPAAPWTRRSLYLKVRDRASYEFAAASAAVALDLEDGVVRTSRIALGGVATVPWRPNRAEDALRGGPINAETARRAAEVAFAAARSRKHNAFKIELGKRTLVRALQGAAAIEI
jgi:xanthine dehydrogenase YagS FAD-binding subunit